MRNILIIKLRYLGDVLLATPTIGALRLACPGARLTALVNSGTEDILRWNPDLDELVVLKRGQFIDQIKFAGSLRNRFDCVIDLTDADRSAIIARITGAPVRIGFNEEHRWRGLLYTHVAKPLTQCHRLERDLEALRPLGLEPKAGPLVLCTSADDEEGANRLLQPLRSGGTDRPLVMFQPGARYWFKMWPLERYAALADRMADELGAQVLIGGQASEHGLAEQIRTGARTKPVNLAGRTTLLQHAAILKQCALYVGGDNGPMHMAAALGIPVVALFGPSDPAEWGPRGSRCEVLYRGLDCRACFHPTCRLGEKSCMNQITVDEVFSAASFWFKQIE